VVIDNLQGPDEMRQIIEATGATLRYQPPYRSDLNPIEQLFWPSSRPPCKAKERTLPALYDRIAQALKALQARIPQPLHKIRICLALIGFCSRANCE
jgi:transposase